MNKLAKFIFCNVIVLAFLLEASLGAFFSFKNKGFVTAEILFQNEFFFDAIDKDGCNWNESIGLHPYTSFYYPETNKCWKARGIRSLPFNYDSNYYTLLVQGASVAEQIAHVNSQNENFLENYLNAHWSSPTKKPFRVISSAMAGSRQPATAIQALLHSKLADEGISIEGYNEHFSINQNQFLEMPAYTWLELVVRSEYPLEFSILKSVTTKVRNIEQSILRYSYSFFAISKFAINYLRSDLDEKKFAFNPYPYPENLFNESDRLKNYLESYLGYLEKSDAIFKYQKKPYTVFLQPSSFFFKVLTEDEKKAVGDISFQHNYKIIKDFVTNRSNKALRVVSLDKVFLNEKDTLYVDHIHTNTKGVEILSKNIAERLAEINGWKSK